MPFAIGFSSDWSKRRSKNTFLQELRWETDKSNIKNALLFDGRQSENNEERKSINS